MDLTTLKKLGLSDKDIKVYLGLLKSGAISVRDLATAVNLNRGTVYDVLKRLQELGLASYYHQDTKQKFVAEEPEKLNKVLKEREAELHKIKESFEELIPELKSLQDKKGDKPTSKFYEGNAGVRFILNDCLYSVAKTEEKEYYIYSATNVSEDLNHAYPDFTKTRIKKGVKVRAISLAKGGNLKGLDERRWLSTSEDSATYIIIYAGKCAFISRDSNGSPVGVLIENEMIYKTQTIIFKQLWEFLGK
jgi:HTH-type transcriptional regulator, sugar sensing transcriptional regulator